MSFPLEKRIVKLIKKGILLGYLKTDTDNGVDEESSDDDYGVIATTCIFSSSKPEIAWKWQPLDVVFIS